MEVPEPRGLAPRPTRGGLPATATAVAAAARPFAPGWALGAPAVGGSGPGTATAFEGPVLRPDLAAWLRAARWARSAASMIIGMVLAVGSPRSRPGSASLRARLAAP